MPENTVINPDPDMLRCLLICCSGGLCKTQQDYEADFDVLKAQAGSTIVRTYSVIDINVPQYRCEVAATILPAAKARNVQVILGLWYATAAKQLLGAGDLTLF